MTAIDESRERLTETAVSQARLIEAVGRFNQKYNRQYPEGSKGATLSQIIDAHKHYQGFGETGEFTLARKAGKNIVFLLSHRHHDLDNPQPVSYDSPLAAPMKLALSGKSGTIIDLDYRGKTVLAAHEPVNFLNLGIVAKLDIDEIRAPFIEAIMIVLVAIVVLIILGSTLFIGISNPIVKRLQAQNQRLAEEISLRKRSEETLRRESEIFMNTLLDAIPMPVYYKDKNGQYLGLNKAFELFFGKPANQLIGRTVFEIHPPELAEIYHAKDIELYQKGGTQQYELQVQDAAGKLRDVVFHKATFSDQQGDIKGLISVIVDMTKEKKAEIERQEREQLLNEMGSIAKIGGWEHDLITGKAVWTKETYKIVDIAESDPIPGPEEHLGYYPPEDRARLGKAYQKAVETGEEFDLELQCSTAKGKLFWARAMGRPVFAHNECIKMKGTFQDITAKKKMEERLQQSDKLESIGKLAGGVAHDYNNMLSVIIGFTELAMEKANREDPIYDDLKEIFDAANRSTDITKQLLAFARQQTIDPKVLDLNAAVERMLKMLKRLIGEDIDVSWQPQKGVWPVRIDPAQLNQILTNLCVNARDAITDVGKVTIETSNIQLDRDYCAEHAGFIPGDFVMLAVSDDGCGISPDILEKIFEPFFTTKGMGQGTGLGLSTVYGIVKQNGGFYNVYSEPAEGTTVRIYLPRHTGKIIELDIEKAGDDQLSKGETVLLVEDDVSIMKMGQKLIENLGYTVLTATSPAGALQMLNMYGSQVDLLITDVVMPEMNGRELSDQLQALHPKLKTLYMSGYTANVIAHRGVLDPDVFFIPKPFSKKDMARKIREVLDF